MSTGPRFLTINDVGDTLNVSPRQVRALLAAGDLRGIQIGGRGEWRIEDVELESYIARQYEQTDARQRGIDHSAGSHDSDSAEEQDSQPPRTAIADGNPNEV